jgi:hypothetical protein
VLSRLIASTWHHDAKTNDGQMWGCLTGTDTTGNASATVETVAAASLAGVGNMLIGNNSQLARIRCNRLLRSKPTHLTSSSPS